MLMRFAALHILFDNLCWLFIKYYTDNEGASKKIVG